jgi:hypothetical protein
MRYLVFFAICSSLICFAACQTVPQAKIIEYGLYEKVSEGKSVKIHGTESEYIRTGEMAHIKRTRIIPAKLENYFGFEYELYALPPRKTIKLDISLSHPSFKQPDGTISTFSSYYQKLKVSPSGEYHSAEYYGFNHKDELTPGKWVFQYHLGNVLLMEQEFNVVEVKE